MSELKENAGLARTLGRFPSGLYIVTVRRGSDRAAFLASWVQQASFSPPTVTVAIQAGRPACELLEGGGVFAVNVIAKGDPAGLMKHFGKGFAPGSDPYVGVSVSLGSTGVELLDGALGAVECRVVDAAKAGDHTVFVGEIVDGRSFSEEAEPATHIRKSGFHY